LVNQGRAWADGFGSCRFPLDCKAFQGFLGVTLGIVAAFTAMHFAWRTVDDYVDGDDKDASFKTDWKNVSPATRIWVTVSIFGMLFGAFIVGFAASMS
jgi:hypothetical protein